jgi:mannosyltransferase OCH1-like enzyme
MPAEKADIWKYCILYRQGCVLRDIKSALTIPLITFIKSEMTLQS